MNPFELYEDAIPYLDHNGKKYFRPKEVVAFWLTSFEAAIGYKTGLIRLVDDKGVVRTLDFEQVMNQIYSDSHCMPYLKFSPQLIANELGIWKEDAKSIARLAYCKALTFSAVADLDSRLNTLVAAWSGPDVDAAKREYDKTVVAHFIWQVKRKLMDLPTDYHMMPLLYGDQGCGKTKALHHFLAPVNDLYIVMSDMSLLNDERQLKLVCSNYVMFADEMAKANQVQLGVLKNIIGESALTQRVMGTTQHVYIKNNITFIGASNEPIMDLIFDPTGMRRFWQIDCPTRLDWDAVNAFDYLTLWKAVDENGPAPILKYAKEVDEYQTNVFRNKDSVELYIQECSDGYTPTADEAATGAKWVIATKFFDSYRIFCERNGLQVMRIERVGRQVRHRGGITKRTKHGTAYLAIKKSADPSSL